MFKNTNKKRLIIIVSVLLLTLVVAFFYKKSKETTTQVPTGQTGPEWDGVVPGRTTKEDLLNTLGNPISEKTTGNTNYLDYKSDSETRNDKITITNGTVSLVKEIISSSDKKVFEEMYNKYGISQYELYGPDALNGFTLHVYPDRGFAYLGNEDSEVLLEKWYFTPTDFNTFKSNFALDYSTSLPKTF